MAASIPELTGIEFFNVYSALGKGFFIENAKGITLEDITLTDNENGVFNKKLTLTGVVNDRHNKDEIRNIIIPENTGFRYFINEQHPNTLIMDLTHQPQLLYEIDVTPGNTEKFNMAKTAIPPGIEPNSSNNGITKARKRAVYNTWQRGRNLPSYNEYFSKGSKGGKHSYRRKSSRKSKKSQKTRKTRKTSRHH